MTLAPNGFSLDFRAEDQLPEGHLNALQPSRVVVDGVPEVSDLIVAFDSRTLERCPVENAREMQRFSALKRPAAACCENGQREQ